MTGFCECVVDIEQEDRVLDRALVERGVDSCGGGHGGSLLVSLELTGMRTDKAQLGWSKIVRTVRGVAKQGPAVLMYFGVPAGMAAPHRSFAVGTRGVCLVRACLDPDLVCTAHGTWCVRPWLHRDMCPLFICLDIIGVLHCIATS